MIYIDKTNKSPDPAWLIRADAETQQLLTAATTEQRTALIDANATIWRELKDFLLDISHQKCWYSESKDSYNHLHVDHFRPKTNAYGIDKKDYGGYWWLAFQWNNYRVCGGAGNVRKKDKFAVRANKANNPTANLEDETIYFLDPTDEEDTLKLTFNSSGEIAPLVSNGWDFERAEYTIKNLNLNFKKLKESRKELWVKCSGLVSEIQALMNQNNIAPSPYRSGQIKEKLKQLKGLVSRQSPFSATAKACLRSTGIQWAVAYAA